MYSANQKTQERQYLIPMEVTEETIRDYEIAPADVVWARIGNRRVKAILVPVERNVYYAYMRPLWREDKQRQRSRDREVLCGLGDGRYDVPAIDAQPDTIVLEQAEQEALSVAMEQLEQRDIVILRMFAEGYAESAIAQAVGMSQKGVNKRKHKALAQLRAQLRAFDV